MKRTPFRCLGKPLRRVELRQQSKKRTRENGVRAAMTAAARTDRDWCLCCGLPADQMHLHEVHSAGQGGSRIDQGNTVLVCDRCNGFFEDNPIWSAWNGWRASKKQPRDPKLPAGHARNLDGRAVALYEKRTE